MSGRIRVVGLRDFAQRCEVAAEVARSWTASAVTQVVTGTVRGTRQVQPHLTGSLSAGTVGQVVPGGSQLQTSGQVIEATGVREQTAGWLDYGGKRGRPYDPEGRWLWPVARQEIEAARGEAERFATELAEYVSAPGSRNAPPAPRVGAFPISVRAVLSRLGVYVPRRPTLPGLGSVPRSPRFRRPGTGGR